MPRGGRRPGAGAPKGNMNGWRTGARCRRAVEVITEAIRLAKAGEKDKLIAIWLAAFDAGALPRPRADVTDADARVAVEFLHPMLFDCASTQSNAIKRNQSETPGATTAESKTTPERVETAGSAHIAKIQTTIKDSHLRHPRVPPAAES